ncbi:MAG: hypothetical protein H6806_10605 [Planctomycetes bacterium]|nr:hypothetical protein [Planctomycetota bacterium]MCB9901886.1 hypothetical protein [Planctomycetota bacterium]
MDREGWLYVLAFLAIVGAGAWFVVPRLGSPEPAPAPVATPEPEPEAPTAPEVPVRPEDDIPEPPPARRVRLEVRAAEGRLRGPLRDVVGARTEILEASVAGGPVALSVQAEAARVAFGAVGHLWVEIGTESLEDGTVIELPAAATPLVVRVREPDGRPATGVPVRVTPPVPGPTLRTDDGGTVVLDHLPPGLVVVDLGSAERSGPVRRFVAGRDTDVTLVLDPPLEVVGRAVDGQGRALAGAIVEGFGPVDIGVAMPADSQGRFLWRGPAVARLSLRVRAHGKSPRRLAVTPPATGSLRLDVGNVVLDAAGVTVRGHVDSPFVAPGARVDVEPEVAAVVRELFGAGQALDRPRSVPLAADGTFELRDLEADLPLRVGVRGAGVDLDQRIVASPGDEVDVHLAPPAGWALHGRVLRPDGTPRPGVGLLVSPVPRDGDQVQVGDRRVETGADGSFVLRGWGLPRAFVRAYVPGYRSVLSRIELPLARPIELVLEPALLDDSRRVQGVVQDERGRGLAGVTLRAAGIETVSGEDGRFVLDGVESLAPAVDLVYGYDAGRPGDPLDPLARVVPRRETVTPGAAPLRLLLPASGSVTLEPRDGLADQPLAFVQVFARSLRDGRVVVDRGFALHDGRLQLHDLPAEGLDVALFAPGLRWTGTMVIPPGTMREHGVVLLHRGARVTGRVVDEQDRPVAGARIGLFDRGWQSRGADPVVEREQLFRSATTDADGRFVLDGLGAPRPHPLRAYKESVDLAIGAANRAPTTVRVDLGKEPGPDGHEVRVTLQEGAFLGLDLTERVANPMAAVGAPVFGAIVDLESGTDGSNWLDLVQWGTLGGPLGDDEAWRRASSNLLLEARSDDGYLVGPVNPGPYELIVSRPGYAPFRQKLTIVGDGAVLYRDLTSGAERRFEGRRSYFRFALRGVE